MTKEEFKKYIEYPLDKPTPTYIGDNNEAEMVFWRRIELSATIARTARFCLKYPDLAKEYLDSLPKATMD